MSLNFFKSRKNARNNNVESNDPFQILILQVPYSSMAKVAEGLKDSFLNEPNPTTLVLDDNVYNVQLRINWYPRIHNEKSPLCTMDRHMFALYHNGEEVRHWIDDEKEYYSFSIDYKKMQHAIDLIVRSDMEEVRKAGVDPNNQYMRCWLTGHMVRTPLFPSFEFENLINNYR